MISTLRKWLGIGPQTDFKALLREGGQLIDVRTREEFQQGHIKGAVNIPLSQLSTHLSKLRKEKPVITCCASGVRSSQARNILASKGFVKVFNGGGWRGLERHLQH